MITPNPCDGRVMLHDDMLAWNHLKFHPGGPYYQAFWNWYHQFASAISWSDVGPSL